jgi:hypothetical protein
MQALTAANATRAARCELKERVASGELAAADVILECPWMAERMVIGDLLASQRYWGTTRARTLLTAIGMQETKTLQSLTERQRHALADILRAPGSNRARMTRKCFGTVAPERLAA